MDKSKRLINNNKNKPGRNLFILRISVIVFAVYGAGTEFYFATGTIGERMEIFSYYTIQTALLSAAGMIYLLANKNISVKKADILGLSLGVWTFVSFAGYHFLLSRIWFPEGIRGVSNIVLHYVLPALVIIHYFSGKKVIFRGMFYVLLYPVIYVTTVLFRGYITGFYPYWFLNPSPEGAGSTGNVIFVILMLSLIYIFTGSIFFRIQCRKYRDIKYDTVNSKKGKAAVFWFSGTGNTGWTAKLISGILNSKGYECSSYYIGNIKKDELDHIIKNASVCGFGYPVYGSDIPLPMKDFMKYLPRVTEKKTFVFCTQWLWSGDGARIGKILLEKKGFNCIWGEHFSMPNNVCITKSNILPFTNDPVKIEKYLEKTRNKCYRFVSMIDSGERHFRGSDPLSFFSGYFFQRKYFIKFFPRLRNDISFDENRCTVCGKCIKMCPVGNIDKDNESGMYGKGKCILCLKCYNFCPESAVKYRNKNFNLKRGVPYRGPKSPAK